MGINKYIENQRIKIIEKDFLFKGKKMFYLPLKQRKPHI